MVQSMRNAKPKPEPGAEPVMRPEAPVTYTFDNRTFIVQPVFKGTPGPTVSAALLRLMRTDLEES